MLGNAKAATKALIERLPEESSFEQIRYEIYVLQAIREGIDDLDNGRTYTQEEVEAEIRTWPSK